MSMNNVTINGNALRVKADTPVQLRNGTLVLRYNRLGYVLDAFIVTSFRDHKGLYHGQDTSTYCSLVNLDNGYIKFEERCSRNTTMARVLSHLNTGDYKGEQAVKDGQYLEVYKLGDYKIDLSFERKSLQEV